MLRYRFDTGVNPDAVPAFFISRPATYPDRLAGFDGRFTLKRKT
jgi:hypothetical protein